MDFKNLDQRSRTIMSVGLAIGAGISMVVLSLSAVILALKDIHLKIELKRDKENIEKF